MVGVLWADATTLRDGCCSHHRDRSVHWWLRLRAPERATRPGDYAGARQLTVACFYAVRSPG